jgi:tellurite resistance protein
MENTLAQPQSRLAFFPVSFFSVIMGLSGLTIAWEKAQHVFNVDLGINVWLVTFTASVFGLLLLLYLGKVVRHPQSVTQELSHPVKLSFFPTISISLLLLATALQGLNVSFVLPVWAAGALLHLVFTLYVVNKWMHHAHFQIQHINPAWFIPAVGNVVVPITGVTLGYVDVSWFFFSVGMFFWLILMTLVFNRMIFHQAIDAFLLPSLFILIAPPAVGFIAYMRLENELDAFARVLYFFGLFLTMLLFSQFGRFAKLTFGLPWWAYSFPLSAITIASFVMYEKSHVVAYQWIASGLLVLLTGLVTLLVVLTLRAVFRNDVCKPGH